MAMSEMRVSAATIENATGDTLLQEIDRQLEAVEDAIQRHMNEHDGALPPKAYEITAKITVSAEGEYMRKIGFGTSRKEPKIESSFSMFARSTDGVLMMEAPARQQAIDFKAVAEEAKAEEER